MKRTPLRRKTAMQRTPMRRGKRSTYAKRPRDRAFMEFVHTLPCAVMSYRMPWEHELTACNGPIEADHMGDRGLSHKADDDTVVPMCNQHHVERTIHRGVFWHATKEQLREWRSLVIEDTQKLFYARSCHS